MLIKWGNSKKGIMKAVWISGVIFGIVHLGNAIYLPVFTVIVQAINATFGGILFAAIYLRCKNIWSVIVVHGLVDWIALVLQQCFIGTTSIITTEMSIFQGVVVIAGGTLPTLIMALFLLHKVDVLDNMTLRCHDMMVR